LRTDFGRGFYVTKIKKQAEEWAKIRSMKYGHHGVVTEFDFLDGEISKQICDVKIFGEYSEEWLDFVVANRSADELSHSYDIVEGPVADDKIATRVNDYIEGRIEKKQFLIDLTHVLPNHQICFCTKRSLQAIRSLDKSISDAYYGIREISRLVIEKLVLEESIPEKEVYDLFYTSATFAKLSDESTLLYQKTWQEIYNMLKKECL
jgi:hypothetical protein